MYSSSEIDNIIEAIYNAHSTLTPFCEYSININETTIDHVITLHKALSSHKIISLQDSRRFINELTPIASDILLHSLNIDRNGKDCWTIYNKALEISGITLQLPQTSTITHESQKIQKDWKVYSLGRLSQLKPLITESEIRAHSITLLPYTNAPLRNIKKLDGKNILIMCELIRRTYPTLILNNSMCFKYDDLPITTRSFDTIRNEDMRAYTFLQSTYSPLLDNV